MSTHHTHAAAPTDRRTSSPRSIAQLSRARPAFARLALALLPVSAALAMMSGCRTEKTAHGAAMDEGGQPASAHARAPEPLAAPDPTRDQFQVASEIQAAEALRGDERANRYREIRTSWVGKRYRWKVYRVPVTCTRADLCSVLPFDRAGADKARVHGWMPRLELARDAYAALAERCGDQAMCQFEFEGTLSEFVLSPDDLTRLAFRDVTVVAAAE